MLGCLPFVSVIAWLGYRAGENWVKVEAALQPFSWLIAGAILLLVLFVVAGLFFGYSIARLIARRKQAAPSKPVWAGCSALAALALLAISSKVEYEGLAFKSIVVGWALAAALAAPTGLLRRLGPFDPDAFLFYEDMDLCLRARAAGVPTVLHPEVELTHTGGHSYGTADPGLLARRRREVVGANLGARALRLDDAAQALEFGVRSWRPRDRARLRALLNARV
jgi:GT2 family glycosyltransferase